MDSSKTQTLTELWKMIHNLWKSARIDGNVEM